MGLKICLWTLLLDSIQLFFSQGPESLFDHHSPPEAPPHIPPGTLSFPEQTHLHPHYNSTFRAPNTDKPHIRYSLSLSSELSSPLLLF
ncbi:hypothetical protein O6P43_022763 [Quillaja saponaria]|uniref:Uncharacterized protein n=1 Tax=Quillaja saponaria TaxID=32244 RepID=A0AAD7LEM9_QUISA|nr:hypothetical protein O6P43_022763 [Quillaja saponaria]